MNPVIVRAIQEKRCLTLRYYGCTYLVEPHAYGLDEEGDALLICYQVGRNEIAMGPYGWRQILLDQVPLMSLSARQFVQPRSGYIRPEPVLRTIFAQL